MDPELKDLTKEVDGVLADPMSDENAVHQALDGFNAAVCRRVDFLELMKTRLTVLGAYGGRTDLAKKLAEAYGLPRSLST